MDIHLISNYGSGHNGRYEISETSSALDVFRQVAGQQADPGNFTILVNGREIAADYQMRADDRMSITPSKVQGA